MLHVIYFYNIIIEIIKTIFQLELILLELLKQIQTKLIT